jgi:uncharacterized protein YifN (PemK superfamily)
MRFGMFALISLALVGPLRAADDPKAIVEKAIKAHGGEENLSKYKAAHVKGKGTMTVMGMDVSFTVELYSQSPNKVRTDMVLEVMGNKFPVSQVYDGKKGWAKQADQVMELEGDQLQDMKDEAYGNYLESLVPLAKDKNLKLEAVPEIKVEGKPAVGVKVESKEHKDMTMYFDKDSGLLVMTKRKSKDPSGMEVESESYARDYKDFNGTKQATKILVKNDGKKFLEGQLTDVKILEKLDDSVFAEPK